MANLSVLVFPWTGSPVVGPGATVLHSAVGDEGNLVAAYNTFLNAVKANLPTGTVVSSPTAGNVLDEASGDVVSSWSLGAAGPVSMTGGTSWVNGVGMRVTWPTIGFVSGRRVVGSTFLVPLVSGAYEGAGNITPTVMTAVTTAAVAMGTTPNALRIYSRPTPGHAGISYPALTGVVPDKVSWLRTRRT